MASKHLPAGHRKRPFKIRSYEVPEAVHMIMEYLHDLCLELGICSQCCLRPLHIKNKKVYSQCVRCLADKARYQNRKRK